MRVLLLVGLCCATASAVDDTLVDLLRDEVDGIKSYYNVPSIAVSVVVGNATVFTYTPGLANVARGVQATNSSVYALASVTKPLTATALLHRLHRLSGRDKTDSVKPLLDGVVNAGSNLDGITYEHVLSHRLEIVVQNSADEDDEYRLWEDAPPSRRLDLALGRLIVTSSTHARYSNHAYLIAGYLLARLSGNVANEERTVADYETAMDKFVFKHLRMRRTANSPTARMVEQVALPYLWVPPRFVPLPQRRFTPMPAGETYSNVVDLAKFLRAHLNPGALIAGKLPNAVTGPMRTSFATTVDGDELGLGWWIWANGGRTYIDHDGVRNGYRAYLVFDPDAKAGLSFLTNGHCPEEIIFDFYFLAVELLTAVAGVSEAAIPDTGVALPPPIPIPPTDLPEFPPDTYLLARDLDTTVVQLSTDGLFAAPPGGLWKLVKPKAGGAQTLAIAPFVGGAFRVLPGSRPATFATGGLSWGTDMAQRSFAPVRKASLTNYRGAWGGTLFTEPQTTPVALRVTKDGVYLTVDSNRIKLVPAEDASGRLVGVAGRDIRRMVRVVLEAHNGQQELIGTWQSGPRRHLLRLRRRASAGWRARFDKRQLQGSWQGDVSRGVDWARAQVSMSAADAGTLDISAIGLKQARVRDVRWVGNRVMFSAGNWRFRARMVGPLLSGVAKNGHNFARFRLRRAN